VEALQRGHREQLSAIAELLRLHAPWKGKRREADGEIFARPLTLAA
jgi:hypothetical protein